MGVQKEKESSLQSKTGWTRIPSNSRGRPQGQLSPVVTDTTFRCVLVIALLNEWNMEVVDQQKHFFME